MVVLVGDIMDYESRFAEMEHIENDLQQLKAPLGVYVVNGNHEYRANRFAKYRWLAKTGAVHLIDSVVQPDSTFYLIGRDDYINKTAGFTYVNGGHRYHQTDYCSGSSTLVICRNGHERRGSGTSRTYP